MKQSVSSYLVKMMSGPPPSRCRPPPDPPPFKLFPITFETPIPISPPEPPDPSASFFFLAPRRRSLASFFSDSHIVSLQTLTQAWDFKSPLSDLVTNSIGSFLSPGPSCLSIKSCEGIVHLPLWNKSFLRKMYCCVGLLRLDLPQCEDVTLSLSLRMRFSLPLYEVGILPFNPLLLHYEDVLQISITMALFYVVSALWSLRLISLSLSSFPLWLIGKKNFDVGYTLIKLVSLGYYRLDFFSMKLVIFPNLPLALNLWDSVLKMILSDAETVPSLASFSKIFNADLLAMVAFKILMSLLCGIVWFFQVAKEFSRALVGSTLLFEALKHCSALLKAEEIIFLSFHIFSDFQVFISTLRLGSVLNEIAGVLHDTRSLATLFTSLSFSFISCIVNVQVVSLAKASLECMNVESSGF